MLPHWANTAQADPLHRADFMQTEIAFSTKLMLCAQARRFLSLCVTHQAVPRPVDTSTAKIARSLKNANTHMPVAASHCGPRCLLAQINRLFQSAALVAARIVACSLGLNSFALGAAGVLLDASDLAAAPEPGADEEGGAVPVNVPPSSGTPTSGGLLLVDAPDALDGTEEEAPV